MKLKQLIRAVVWTGAILAVPGFLIGAYSEEHNVLGRNLFFGGWFLIASAAVIYMVGSRDERGQYFFGRGMRLGAVGFAVITISLFVDHISNLRNVVTTGAFWIGVGLMLLGMAMQGLSVLRTTKSR